MTIPLTPELEQFINERVESGQYKSAPEVIEGALEAPAEQEEILTLRARCDEADAELASGDFMEYDENTIHELADDVIARGMTKSAAPATMSSQVSAVIR